MQANDPLKLNNVIHIYIYIYIYIYIFIMNHKGCCFYQNLLYHYFHTIIKPKKTVASVIMQT